MASTRRSPTAIGSIVPARKRRAALAAVLPQSPARIVPDPYRAFVFPNRIREQRQRRGLHKLMALSELLPDIPYIRLSKIERGEVVARAGEVERIARALDVSPLDLLSDVAQPGFDIAAWARPFLDGRPEPAEEERFAVMLASALRALRGADARLTIAVLDQEYGLPPVILSRLENAHKTLDRWNDATLTALCRLFGAADEASLRTIVTERYERGELDGHVGRITDPANRVARTRDAIGGLRAALSPATPAAPRDTPAPATIGDTPPPVIAPAPDAARMLPVYGAPLPGGLIAARPTGDALEAPRCAGPNAFGLRVCRATLGAGLPAGAIVVADPDRAPTPGGLAAIRTGDGYRLVTMTFDRAGARKGYSVVPDLELDLDDLAPADVIAVIAAVFP